MIQAVLIDFDGTLVTQDMLDVVCELTDKRAESQRINEEFHRGLRPGLDTLITRINYLENVSQKDIERKVLENPSLMPGAKQLFDYLNAHHIVSVLCSGNIMPVLEVYKKLLNITFVVGTKPTITNGIVRGIRKEQFPGNNFKLDSLEHILHAQGIAAANTLAIGDSPADGAMLDFAGVAIAINPKGSIADNADYILQDSLLGVIDILKDIS